MERAQIPQALKRRLGTGDLTRSSFDVAAYEQLVCDSENAKVGNLTGYDCPVCRNKGYVMEYRDKRRICIRCGCMDARASIQRAAESGLQDILRDYTLETYQTVEPWQAAAKRAAERYLEDKTGWFVASGAVGSGKSHLCVAICGNLLTQGRAVRYLMWRDQINRLKAFTEPEERDALLKAYKTADVLYIDDFLKCGRNEQPTKADLDVALEIIMARYNQPGKLTILSTERSVEELLDLDEALGSRVFERSKGHYLRFTGTDKNWRLRR